MINILEKDFGFQIIEIKKLNGYENENYLIETIKNKYIFKKYPYSFELESIIQSENEALLFLSDNNNQFPIPIKTIDGVYVKIHEIEGKKFICRLLSFLDGEMLGSIKNTKEIFESFGIFLAKMNKKLLSYNNIIIKSRIWNWDLQHFHLNEKYFDDIVKAKDRSLVKYFFYQFEENVNPLIPSLRKSIIHSDANEWNVLIRNGKVSSIIDFGDLVYSPLINEIATAITYVSYDKKNPLDWALIILESYNNELPILESEIKILYYLIAARLCISLCNAAHSKKINPENDYAFSSEESALKMLNKWLLLSPIHVENIFRKALGFSVIIDKSIKNVIKRRHKVISPIFSLSYDNPIKMERAAFQYMYDASGNTFLDAYNNIPLVGYSHPKVFSEAKKQMSKLNTNTRYLYDILPAYAEKLLLKFPDKLNKIYFVNSGSEASDLAMKLAYAHTKLHKIMVMENGYHGNTRRAIDISDYKFSHKNGQGKKDYIIKVPMPDTYNGKYTNDEGSAGRKYASDAIDIMNKSKSSVAAFISEPILGCGGQVTLPKGYLNDIYFSVRSQGGICISDEVQTGFGRLGNYFWGFEMHNVIPDIVIIGKPMANGHPIGAVVTTSEVAESFGKGVEFFSSFGGNPVSCAIGMSVLDIIDEERLQENARVVGDYYMSLFKNLQKKYTCIGDVRGSGLFIGIEIVEENSKNPDTKLAKKIKNELRNRKILIGTDGPFDNVIKTKPPLCFTKENARMVVFNIEKILNKMAYKK
jgi:ethanolamine-phosphate phospho-lyase